MQTRLLWFKQTSPFFVAFFALASSAYGVLLYDPCWRDAAGQTTRSLSGSEAYRVLSFHTVLLSAFIVLALLSAAPVISSAVSVFATHFRIKAATWRFWGYAYIRMGILVVIARAVLYIRRVRSYSGYPVGSIDLPYFFWYVFLMKHLTPLAICSAGFSMDYKQGHFKRSAESILASSAAVFVIFTAVPESLRIAKVAAPILLAMACILLFFHYRSVNSSSECMVQCENARAVDA